MGVCRLILGNTKNLYGLCTKDNDKVSKIRRGDRGGGAGDGDREGKETEKKRGGVKKKTSRKTSGKPAGLKVIHAFNTGGGGSADKSMEILLR